MSCFEKLIENVVKKLANVVHQKNFQDACRNVAWTRFFSFGRLQ